MLLCDDEPPSPVSSDEVFFICEKENNISSENDYSSGNRSDCDDSKQKKRTITRLNRCSRSTKKSIDKVNDNDNINGEKNVKEAESQTAHTILVKIQVENCSQCPDKSISLYSHDQPPSGTNNDKNSCKMKKKTVAVQVNFNSIESMVDSHCVKISKVRCCNKTSSLLTQSAGKSNNNATIESIQNEKKTDGKSDLSDSTKIYLWSGGGGKTSLKKKSLPTKSNGITDRVTARGMSLVAPPRIREPVSTPVQRSNSCVEKTSIKSKKSAAAAGACSSLNKLNRSSLTIEPDRITINLSKYSPCASRLAASSKILSNNSQLSPDSPLHGAHHSASPSPRRIFDNRSIAAAKQPYNNNNKTTLQASLSLNIQQFQKQSQHSAPRSRSVGDSCVNSPNSEATTLSYSPTGTEIFSLDEVGGTRNSTNDPTLFFLPQPPPPPPPPPPPLPEFQFHHEYSLCARNVNLETKC